MDVIASLSPQERELLLDLLIRVIRANRGPSRPGSVRPNRAERTKQKTVSKT